MLEGEIPEAINLEKTGSLSSFDEVAYQQCLMDPTFVCIALIEHAKYPSGILYSRVGGIVSGRFVLDELQVDTLVVHPDISRRGFGRFLLRVAVTIARHRGCRSATLEVRSDNTPARLLYESVGFSEVGKRRDYYQNPLGDAVLLTFAWSQ